MYRLKYLPLALKDLSDITNYIANTLKAPKAALDFVNTFENSILRLQEFPYSCKIYKTIQELNFEYRMFPVKNYLVFYIVTENEVEIHRIIYKKRNLENLI